ncbi:hypothetical protein MRB53_037360 [Persea americana]|nr:hypothetical protein MRB53_037360 [Persea americana]
MYADAAHALTLLTARLSHLPQIPAYSTDLVRQILTETRELDRTISATLSAYSSSSASSQGFNPADDPATACSLLAHHLAMRRDKRCPGSRIIGHGVDGSRSCAGPDGRSLPSSGEADYARRYAELLAQVKGRWTEIDLAGNLSRRELGSCLWTSGLSGMEGTVVGEYGYVVVVSRSVAMACLGGCREFTDERQDN